MAPLPSAVRKRMKSFATSARLRGTRASPRQDTWTSDQQLQEHSWSRVSALKDVCARDAGSGIDNTYFTAMSHPGLAEPLLQTHPVTAADRDNAVGMHQHIVTCNGVKGTLTVQPDGGISYEPLQNKSVAWCSFCRTPNPQISGWHVVGAALESPNSFRVWYFTPTKAIHHSSSSSASSKPSPKFKLQKTLPFTCASGSEASALVQSVRQAAAWHGRQSPPQVVAIINPSSGQGRAERVFERQVLPVLQDAAGMSVSSVLTSGPGAATQLVAQLDLDALDVLLFVGGDGTVYEGLQGLLSRPDWDQARRVPIAHVPGGSGNGLAHSCGLRDAATAAFAICKSVVSPLDVASVLQPPGSRQYIMLSVAYGSLANLDINTERFRWMGDVRFTLGAIWEVLKGDKYNASIAWLPADADVHSPPAGKEQSQGQSNGYNSSSSSNLPPLADGNGSSVVIDSAALQEAAAVSSSSTADSMRAGQLPVSSARVASVTAVQPDHFPGPSLGLQDFPAQGPDLPLLQQLGRLPLNIPTQAGGSSSSNLPPGWRVWHEPLQLFACINPPYISATSKMNPKGALHTGHFNMLLYEGLSGIMGRVHALSFLARAETGTHLDTPTLVQDKVRALMFAPKDYGTYLELDGEMIPHVPIYMEVHPGLLQVVISPAHPDEPAAEHSRRQFVRPKT